METPIFHSYNNVKIGL
ncbi:hypothetical protein OIU74_017446 [Salix koriyanagi]|uniref:Uncharacterized protein n=1 Tax=Salix koriyanagi TaxID=2511006 RepID=A0A9Q0WR41_9ROSI|nr:hypothetical protein OIU74_017446 [Salix koriyanagi]